MQDEYIEKFMAEHTHAEVKPLKTVPIITGVCLDPRMGGYDNNPSGQQPKKVQKDVRMHHREPL